MNEEREKRKIITKALVERAKNGEHAALADLFRIYETRLKAEVNDKIGFKLRSQMDCGDLSQSVWREVLTDIKGFEYRGPESFFQWLVTLSMNKIQAKGRYFAAGKRDLRRVNCLGEEDTKTPQTMLPAASDPTPSEVAISKERQEEFQQKLNLFPENQRRILVLRIRDELEYEEIGKITGKSTEATKKMYGRCLKKLIGLIMKGKAREAEE